MRIAPLAILLTAVGTPGLADEAPAKPPPAEQQVKSAVLAAPEDRREGARVLGYDADGALVELRAGANDLVCLADDPSKASFQVACYHVELEPYMARGRALRAEGVAGTANREQRWKEIDEGKLAMPRDPRTLYILRGDGYDPATGEVTSAYRRWVVYTPYATPQSTGLSLQASPSAPWLMFPGTAGAHIMINPPRAK